MSENTRKIAIHKGNRRLNKARISRLQTPQISEALESPVSHRIARGISRAILPISKGLEGILGYLRGVWYGISTAPAQSIETHSISDVHRRCSAVHRYAVIAVERA